MAIRIYSASEIEMKHLSWLFYGRPGAGKTTLSGTFPGPILITNFLSEQGAKTLANHSSVQVVDVGTRGDMDEFIGYAVANHVKYRTIVLDSLTTLVDMLMRQFIAENNKMPNFAQWADWKGQIFSMVDRLRNLPCEKVYTALLTARDQVMGEDKIGQPAMFKSLEEQLPGKMDAVIYLEAETDRDGFPTFFAYPSGKGDISGRFRGIKPSGRIENPSGQKLFDLLKKGSLWSSVPSAGNGDGK